MRHSLQSITERSRNIIEFQNFSSYGTNESEIVKMKHILKQAVTNELTTRQRECVEMYFYDGMKMKEIAILLCLSPSTVTRHIKAGVKKLKNVAKYY